MLLFTVMLVSGRPLRRRFVIIIAGTNYAVVVCYDHYALRRHCRPRKEF